MCTLLSSTTTFFCDLQNISLVWLIGFDWFSNDESQICILWVQNMLINVCHAKSPPYKLPRIITNNLFSMSLLLPELVVLKGTTGSPLIAADRFACGSYMLLSIGVIWNALLVFCFNDIDAGLKYGCACAVLEEASFCAMWFTSTNDNNFSRSSFWCCGCEFSNKWIFVKKLKKTQKMAKLQK